MQKMNNPLNGRGTAMIVAAPAMFGVCEAIFHANPIVGGALAILGGAIAYRHYDDVETGVERLKEGSLSDYVPSARKSEAQDKNVPQPENKTENFSDIRDIPAPIGVQRNGKRFDRTIRQLKSTLILGLQEGGKTNTAIHLLRHFVKYGARLAIIDKHARSEEDSMTSKIKCLEHRFDCPVGIDPVSSMNVVAHVRAVLDERLEGGKCDYPLFLVVDEFTAIMRQKEEGGKWQSCGQVLASLIEDINTEGRKHQVFCICVGQIANVSRTGGGEIRDLFATRIAHAMSAKQANLLGLTEVNKQVEALNKGEVFIQTEGTNAFWLKIPKVDTDSLRKLAKSLPSVERRARNDDGIFDGSFGSYGSPSTQKDTFQAQNQENSLEAEEEAENNFREVYVTCALRDIAKRARSGEKLADIRRAYGLPTDGRALQEVNEALRLLGENTEVN